LDISELETALTAKLGKFASAGYDVIDEFVSELENGLSNR